MIVTLPVPVAEMLADDVKKTPVELVSVPHEVPLITIEPESVVTLAPGAWTPYTLLVDPFPLTPVMETQPDPPACTLDDESFTPTLAVFNAPRPSMVIVPLVVITFTVAPLIHTPSNGPV